MSIEQLNRTLQRTTGQLAHTQDLRAFLGHILHEMVLLVGARYAHLLTFDAAEETLAYAAGADPEGYHLDPREDEPEFFKTRFAAAQLPVFGWSRGLHREAVLSRDAGEAPPHPELAAWFRAHGIEEALALALLAGDEPVGLVGLAFQSAPALSPGQRELFHALANQAALAIRMAALAEQAREAALARERERAAEERAATMIRQAEALARANAATRTTLARLAERPDLQSFLGHVLREVAARLNVPVSSLWFYDLEHRQAELHLVYSDERVIPGREFDHPNAGAPAVYPPGNAFWHTLTVLREPRLIRGVQDNEDLPPEQRTYFQQREVQGLLAVPLVYGEKAIGMISVCLTREECPSPEDLELVQTLANQATLAVELGRLGEAAMQAAVAEDRNRLAREIHDSLAQAFTGIALHLGGAERLLDATHEDLRTHLLLARELAREGLAEARRSVRALRPLALDSVSLPEALTQLAARTSRTLSREVEVEIRGEPAPLPPEVEDHVLRIAQEALANVAQHAAPQRVRVVLEYGPEVVRLVVADDGQGFDLNSGITRGFGLVSMRERAARIGAELTISSEPGKGTTLDLGLDRRQLQLPAGGGDR